MGWGKSSDRNRNATQTEKVVGFANMKSHAHLNCSTRLDQNPQPKEEQTREGYPMRILDLDSYMYAGYVIWAVIIIGT